MVENWQGWNTTKCLRCLGVDELSFVWVPGNPPPSIEEHSLAKLAVLRSYVSEYIDRLCGGSRRDVFKLDLVDGFAGGGLFRDNGVDVSGTPLIMLEEAQAAHVRLNDERVKPLHFDLKFHFVDIACDHIRYLNQVLSEREFNIAKHEVQVYCSAFEDVVGDIIADIKRRQPLAGRALFLLDQKGFSQVGLALVRKIFDELAHAEVILTFAVEAMLNHMAERPQFYAAVRPIELSETDIRDLMELRGGAGGRAVAQRMLRDHVRIKTGAHFDTPFFIKPGQSRRALWFVHLSRHPVARDVMIQCHWKNFNTFEHYGSGGLDMMGWDPLKSGLLPLFGFSQYDADLLHDELLGTIPEELATYDSSTRLSVRDFRANVANRTAARFSDLDKALSVLASGGELDILTKEGKLRQKGLVRLDPTDLIVRSVNPMFPGWSSLGPLGR